MPIRRVVGGLPAVLTKPQEKPSWQKPLYDQHTAPKHYHPYADLPETSTPCGGWEFIHGGTVLEEDEITRCEACDTVLEEGTIEAYSNKLEKGLRCVKCHWPCS